MTSGYYDMFETDYPFKVGMPLLKVFAPPKPERRHRDSGGWSSDGDTHVTDEGTRTARTSHDIVDGIKKVLMQPLDHIQTEPCSRGAELTSSSIDFVLPSFRDDFRRNGRLVDENYNMASLER